MIIERFRGGNPQPVYDRFREKGRMAPDGLVYVASWVTEDLTTCYQVMETPTDLSIAASRALVDQWIANWNDLVEFEIILVMSSSDAAQRAAARAPD